MSASSWLWTHLTVHWGERGDPTSVLPVRDSKGNEERESAGQMERRGATKAEPLGEDVATPPWGPRLCALGVSSAANISQRNFGPQWPAGHGTQPWAPGEAHRERAPSSLGVLQCGENGMAPPTTPASGGAAPRPAQRGRQPPGPFLGGSCLRLPSSSPQRGTLQFSCLEEPRRAWSPQG